jgi:hypothetical protein
MDSCSNVLYGTVHFRVSLFAREARVNDGVLKKWDQQENKWNCRKHPEMTHLKVCVLLHLRKQRITGTCSLTHQQTVRLAFRHTIFLFGCLYRRFVRHDVFILPDHEQQN